MEEIFNPYQAWLGWDQGRVPNYYELLRIDSAETDAARIALAAEQAMTKVRSFRPGPNGQVWSRLLDEIRAARDCLSNGATKADYDAALARADRLRSSAGDLRASMRVAAIPPLSGSAGPAPIFNRQHGVVSVPTAFRTASSGSDGFECNPLPGAIDELLPPGVEGLAPIEQLSSVGPRGGEVTVLSAPSAGEFAMAQGRKARRALAWVVIGSIAVGIVGAAIFVWQSPNQEQPEERTATIAEVPPVAVIETPPALPPDAPPTKPAPAAVEPVEQVPVSSSQPLIGTAPAPTLSQSRVRAVAEGANAAGTTVVPKPALPTEGKLVKVQALVQALEKANEALGKQDFTAADEQLRRAESLADSPKHRAAVARLAEIADYVKQFREAVAAAVQGMQAAETFKVSSGTEVAFVEGFPDMVTLRVLGRNSTYPFRDLPPALALAIAERKLPARNPTSAAVKGAYLAVHKQRDNRAEEKAKTFWEEAEAGGLKTAHLMPFFTDNYADFLKDAAE